MWISFPILITGACAVVPLTKEELHRVRVLCRKKRESGGDGDSGGAYHETVFFRSEPQFILSFIDIDRYRYRLCVCLNTIQFTSLLLGSLPLRLALILPL